MIMTLIFDFGGVLVDWDPHHLYDEYFGSREKTDWFLANVCTMAWNVQMDGGKPFAGGSNSAGLPAILFPGAARLREMFLPGSILA